MLFNSLEFLVFFPVVTVIYFLLPYRFRWIHLLAASCLFYMAFIPVYILILIFTIVVDYIAGILIEKAEGPRRKFFLVCSITANVGVLAFFKYFNFLLGNVNELLHHLHPAAQALPLLAIILPIGLSFHTFQAMSYTIEVYRGRQRAERHFGIYALYVMFYPQLVAGPIERPQNLIHQFHEEKKFDYDSAVSGLRLMLWGYFKKVTIADRLALLTDPVFNHPHNYPPLTLAIAAFFFTFQIYCDFSAYSDIAIGAARIMGFKLMKNFDRPYFSRSISEFWTRWHISLSTWFRDYLYIPLGGNRVSVPRWFFNLFVVFLISGLWHGASWTFVIWGFLHWLYLIIAILIQRRRPGQPDRSGNNGVAARVLSILLTFFLVSVAWIFFRAGSFSDAMYILGRLPLAFGDLLQIFHSHKLAFMNIWSIPEYGTLPALLLAFSGIAVLLILEYLDARLDLGSRLSRKNIVVRWLAYYSILTAIYCFGIFDSHQFIYFQF
jgi:D-alanyl-lipoteichoic acid acyltransferase DltB (MBOAT superfamily)